MPRREALLMRCCERMSGDGPTRSQVLMGWSCPEIEHDACCLRFGHYALSDCLNSEPRCHREQFLFACPMRDGLRSRDAVSSVVVTISCAQGDSEAVSSGLWLGKMGLSRKFPEQKARGEALAASLIGASNASFERAVGAPDGRLLQGRH